MVATETNVREASSAVDVLGPREAEALRVARERTVLRRVR